MIKLDIKKELNEFILDVKFNIKKNEFIAISGVSGSGKTTILRIIAGLEKAKGEVIVDNEIWQNKKLFLPPQKREVGFVFQDFALFPNMSVLENLLYVKKDIEFANYLLKLVELEELKNRYPNSLSGGQKQRVALARALMRKPKILLLDEPFSALDEKLREKLQNYIIKLHNKFNLTTIIVSHSTSEIYKLANRVINISRGKIVSIKTPKPSKAKVIKKDKNQIILELEDDNINIGDEVIVYNYNCTPIFLIFGTDEKDINV